MGEGDLYGAVICDMTDEGDASFADGEVEGAMSVDVVGNGDIWWPAQLV